MEKVYSTICSRDINKVLTLLTLDEREHLRFPRFFNREDCMFINMDDVNDETAYYAPKKDDIHLILNWSKRLPKYTKLLVHCFGGISRSTAVALAIKVQCNGLNKIDDCILWLLKERPMACPNKIITKYADELLNANGKLINAVENIVKMKIIANRKI
jgi:predicted protein tyrosine phosphatase